MADTPSSLGGAPGSTGRALVGFAVSAGVTALFFALYWAGCLEALSSISYDWQMRRWPDELDERIVIVDLDDETTRKLGIRLGGWTREHRARALEHLGKAGASVIAYDFVFDQPTTGEADAAFERALAAIADADGAVVLACNSSPGGGMRKPIDRFARNSYAKGHIHMAADGDGIIRRMIYTAGLGDAATMAMPICIVCAFEYLEEDQIGVDPVTGGPIYGEHSLPSGSMLINFPGPAKTFKYIPAWRIHSGQFDPKEIEGKIVLLGTSHQLGQDFKHVPTHWKIPGVEIHAAAVASILNDSYIRPTPRLTVALLLVALAFLTGAVSAHHRTGLATTAVVAVAPSLIVIGGAVQAFRGSHIFFDWVPVVMALVASSISGGFYSWLLETMRSSRIQGIFGRYVSKNVVEKLVAEGGASIALAGRREELSVLFCDIRGFTSISERMEPVEVGKLLNTYFGDMIRIIFECDGTMDKLMGDCIMAFFGDPLPNPDHAKCACRCALAMLGRVGEINASRPDDQRISVGVGLNTGPVTVGNMGAASFVDYTVVGDNVNLASRLEGLTRIYGIDSIVGDATRQAVGDCFDFRELDLVAVKGRTEPVRIYELLALAGEAEAGRVELRDAFEEALAIYRDRSFTEAAGRFAALAEEHGDAPSRLFDERCREFASAPPSGDWDGVFVAKAK